MKFRKVQKRRDKSVQTGDLVGGFFFFCSRKLFGKSENIHLICVLVTFGKCDSMKI